MKKTLKDCNKIYLSVLAIFLLITSFGCAAIDTPYIHPTDNKTGGIEIIHRDWAQTPSAVKFQYFIDGRKVASHHALSNFQTLVQLPQGYYQLVIQRIEVGATPFMESLEYSFSLDENQTGSVTLVKSQILNKSCWMPLIENVKSFSLETFNGGAFLRSDC